MGTYIGDCNEIYCNQSSSWDISVIIVTRIQGGWLRNQG